MLVVNNIFKTFNPGTPDEVRALQGVSFSLDEGGFLVVIGTNGSGKTSLLNAVAGSFFIDSGEILIDGVDVGPMAEHQRASLIGRVFQNPFLGTAADMTIEENLTLAAKRGKRRGLGLCLNAAAAAGIKERVKSLTMALEDRMTNIVGSLSGGQRQALTLLMATWSKPKLLLLDEHTAALDPKTAKKVVELTEDVIKKHRLTTLMVTHSMQQAVNLGDRIIMMHKGRIVYDFKGDEKRLLRAGDLLALFNEIRRKEQIDISAAEMLQRNYI
ncbi:MAG: ATP-binding cassette domain-containing protein [Deltaproteobacteria bacterium]|nr:ATP-binding cassette domain-containing protein [Deltaproteobacteria bacterium]